jgi:hypothetical protein
MTIDCPACGTTLVCSGCGEDVANTVEQSIAIVERNNRIKELEHCLAKIVWEVRAGATDTEVLDLCRAALNARHDEEDSCTNCKHADLDLKEHPCNVCDETDDRWEVKG